LTNVALDLHDLLPPADVKRYALLCNWPIIDLTYVTGNHNPGLPVGQAIDHSEDCRSPAGIHRTERAY